MPSQHFLVKQGRVTQSTRTAAFGGGATGGLDDRFDLILFSQSVNDYGGISYREDIAEARSE